MFVKCEDAWINFSRITHLYVKKNDSWMIFYASINGLRSPLLERGFPTKEEAQTQLDEIMHKITQK